MNGKTALIYIVISNAQCYNEPIFYRGGVIMSESKRLKQCPICKEFSEISEMYCSCGYEFGGNRCTNPNCKQACDDFDPGTYNVTWLEGNGNIQTNPYDSDTGINEIMGEKTATYDELQELNDKLYIRLFNNLILNEGDILEINDIKIKLTPSK